MCMHAGMHQKTFNPGDPLFIIQLFFLLRNQTKLEKKPYYFMLEQKKVVRIAQIVSLSNIILEVKGVAKIQHIGGDWYNWNYNIISCSINYQLHLLFKRNKVTVSQDQPQLKSKFNSPIERLQQIKKYQEQERGVQLSLLN